MTTPRLHTSFVLVAEVVHASLGDRHRLVVPKRQKNCCNAILSDPALPSLPNPHVNTQLELRLTVKSDLVDVARPLSSYLIDRALTDLANSAVAEIVLPLLV